MVNKIESNLTGLSLAVEATLGVLPANPVWEAQEPNSYGDLGGEISTLKRDPITNDRQNTKGTIADLEASANFETDFTQNNLAKPLAAFMFALPREKAATAGVFANTPLGAPSIAVTSFNAVAGTITLAAPLPVAVGHIVILRNSASARNNNAPLTVTAINGSVLTVAPVAPRTLANFTDDASGTASLHVAGVKFAAAAVTLVGAADSATLTSLPSAPSFIDLQLSAGEWVFVGGDSTSSRFAETPAFYARIKSVTARTLVFDTTTSPIPATTVATGIALELYMGTFFRNEDAPAAIKRITFTAERTLGNDATGPQAEYVRGCAAHEFSLSLKEKEKAMANLSFIGLNNYYRDGAQGLLPGTRVAALGEDAYNMSTDVYRQRLAIRSEATMNPSALYAFVQELDVKINNEISADGAIGVLGAFDLSAGNFMVEGSLTAYFATVEAVKAVRNNETVGIDIILAHNNVATVVDMPSLTLAGGRLNVEKDQSIKLPLTTEAFKNEFKYTLGITSFKYVPTVAMPQQ
jgi:hypothetical protein